MWMGGGGVRTKAKISRLWSKKKCLFHIFRNTFSRIKL